MAADKRAYYVMDVGYFDNPKIADLVEDHPRAVILHQACISYAAQHLTDGKVPMRLALLRACAEPHDIDLLVANGLLTVIDDRNVEVHDYLKHQRSAEKVKDASDKGLKGAEARWEKERADAQGNAQRMPDAMPNPMPNAMPRERDRETNTPPTVEGRKRGAHTLPKGWIPSEAARKTILAERPGLDLAAEHLKFADYFENNGRKMKVWDSAWRNWMRSARINSATAVKSRGERQFDSTVAELDAWVAEEDNSADNRRAISQ